VLCCSGKEPSERSIVHDDSHASTTRRQVLFAAGADITQLAEASAPHGLSLQLEWVPELTAKYQLKLMGQ
jgi:hypothetical protein